MGLLVIIFVVIAALVVITSGVWVATVLVSIISSTKAGKENKPQETRG